MHSQQVAEWLPHWVRALFHLPGLWTKLTLGNEAASICREAVCVAHVAVFSFQREVAAVEMPGPPCPRMG